MQKAERLLIPLIAAAALLFPVRGYPAQVVLDSEKQFAFARHCIDQKEYDRAAQELERLVYFFPEDERVPEARYLAGWCYVQERRLEKAREILWEVGEAYRGKAVAAKAILLVGETYRLQEAPDEAGHYFRRVIAEYPDTEHSDVARYRLGWTGMESGRWEEASEAFGSVDETSPLRPGALALSEKALEASTELPSKSPGLAGIMAGVLPGLGHAYCERYKDASVAFLVNGMAAWAAVESFRQDHDALGGMLSFLGLGWYTGNIYSAVNCAHKYNRKAREDFVKGLPDHLKLGVFSSSRGDLGLGLSFDF